MDSVHRERITSNLPTLIDKTRLHSLLKTFEALDNNNEVIPERLMTLWKLVSFLADPFDVALYHPL